MGQLFDGRNGGQVQGVSVLGLKGSDAALTQHHIPVASGHDVLGGQEELLDRRGEPALEQHRLIVGADYLEERELLPVARADLDGVRVFHGARMGVTLSTPGKAINGWFWRIRSSPMTPMIVRSCPFEMCDFNPSSRSRSRM